MVKTTKASSENCDASKANYDLAVTFGRMLITINTTTERKLDFRKQAEIITAMFRNFTKNNLKIIYWNAQGVSPKINKLEAFIQERKPDALLLGETFLTILTYKTDRSIRTGGGTAALVKTKSTTRKWKTWT